MPLPADLHAFATRYAAAWSNHRAGEVVAFYSPNGSLTINGAAPAVGRMALEASVQAFMTGYPDLVVSCDRLVQVGERVHFHWTLIGTNSGPGGTGRQVRISGFEDWQFGDDFLVAQSLGHYDAADWDRQVQGR